MSTTGGPAFPFIQWRSPDGMIHSDLSAGMTLRDYFAAKAMQGMLSDRSNIDAIVTKAEEQHCDMTVWLADMAYECADAMLKAREGKP